MAAEDFEIMKINDWIMKFLRYSIKTLVNKIIVLKIQYKKAIDIT